MPKGCRRKKKWRRICCRLSTASPRGCTGCASMASRSRQWSRNRMRTVKAYSVALNHSKWAALRAIAQAYAAEKQDHLWALGDDLTFAGYDKQEQYRDALLDAG